MSISMWVLSVSILSIGMLSIWDLLQKKHSILRTYPLIGHMRYILEILGVYLRSFFYAKDREELPFNRSDRNWVYSASKNADMTTGFGSTRNLQLVGTVYFVDAPFPILGQDIVKARDIVFGPYCANPFTTNAILNISAMSFGSISKNAILALSRGAKMAGCYMNTGEGGLTSYHLESGCDLVAQIGTAQYGYRDLEGNLSIEKLIQAASYPNVKMFEIKLSQGAKPGKGGLLLAEKVTPEIAKIRGIPVHTDSVSPNRFPQVSNCSELLDYINNIRNITQKPTGFKTVLGDLDWLNDLCKEIIRRGIEYAPDFITLDGAEGGTGASPLSLIDYVGLPIKESLPALVDILVQYGLRDRIKVIAAGKLITPSSIVWALCMGADIVNSARGFLFSLGCIQAMRCHNNTCPTGITTHNSWLTRGLDPADKAVRVFHYIKNLEYEVGTICHSCGVNEPRELKRQHARVVSEHGTSISMAEVYPDQIPYSKILDPETVELN